MRFSASKTVSKLSNMRNRRCISLFPKSSTEAPASSKEILSAIFLPSCSTLQRWQPLNPGPLQMCKYMKSIQHLQWLYVWDSPNVLFYHSQCNSWDYIANSQWSCWYQFHGVCVEIKCELTELKMTKPHKPHLSPWTRPMVFPKESLVFHISLPDFWSAYSDWKILIPWKNPPGFLVTVTGLNMFIKFLGSSTLSSLQHICLKEIYNWVKLGRNIRK